MNTKGMALLLGLVLLAAVSLLAVLAGSGAVLQRSMASNFRENSLALENAFLASSYARAWLMSRSAMAREPGCQNECILPIGIQAGGELPGQPEFEGAGWWRHHGFSAGYNPETAQVSDDVDLGSRSAVWVIEEIRFVFGSEQQNTAGTGYYRILSRGEGHNPNSVTVLEAIVARPWEGEISAAPYPPTRPDSSYCRQFDAQQACGVLSWRRRR